MTDIKSVEERSKNMSAIKSADTKPELFIRKLLFSSGYRYCIQVSNIPKQSDLWLRKDNTAIFCAWMFLASS
jgi:DNA mismatch endonuclease (patch repair protein)